MFALVLSIQDRKYLLSKWASAEQSKYSKQNYDYIFHVPSRLLKAKEAANAPIRGLKSIGYTLAASPPQTNRFLSFFVGLLVA